MWKMDSRFERYIENLHTVRTLARPRFASGMKAKDLLGAIQSNAVESFRYMKENNAILDELLFRRKPEELTDADVADLQEFAGRLFNYADSADCGIAYKTYCLLLENARLRKDKPVIIRRLYEAGLALHYLNVRSEDHTINPYGARVQEYFNEGAAYLAEYESFDSKTRGYIIRCLGNRRMSQPRLTRADCAKYLQLFDDAMRVIQDPYYRELDPELPWKNFEYAMHMDRMTLLAYLRSSNDAEVAAKVMESAEYIWRDKELYKSEETRLQNWRMDYFYQAARFHAGRCSARVVVEELLKLIDHADIHDYSSNGINLNLTTVAFLVVYEGRMEPKDRRELEYRVEEVLDRSLQYLSEVPQDRYPRTISSSVHDLVEAQAEMGTARRSLLSFILAAHKPTYVHSMMVAGLTRLFVRELLKKTPEKLIGVLDCKTVEEVRQSRMEICELAYECGLYHDVGKSLVVAYISTNTRRLLDEEFTCIQLHPSFGYKLLCDVGAKDDLAQAALYHHRFYDGTGGYPKDCPPCPENIKPIVDALTVADSLDAATDNIGRCYIMAKPVDTLLEEFRAQKGTRYAPAVVELFDDPDFVAHLRETLAETRQSVYLETYHVQQ